MLCPQGRINLARRNNAKQKVLSRVMLPASVLLRDKQILAVQLLRCVGNLQPAQNIRECWNDVDNACWTEQQFDAGLVSKPGKISAQSKEGQNACILAVV